MTGSNTFVAVGLIVEVVLCNTKGKIDAASLIGVALVQCLYHELPLKYVDIMFQESLVRLADYSATQYMVEVAEYERQMRTVHPGEARFYKQCLGIYVLRGLYIRILKHGNLLEFRPLREKKGYVLRVKDGSTSQEISMTFALPIAEAHQAGLGDSDWMDMPRFSLVFRELEGRHMTRVTWTFAGVPEREQEFSFMRPQFPFLESLTGEFAAKLDCR